VGFAAPVTGNDPKAGFTIKKHNNYNFTIIAASVAGSTVTLTLANDTPILRGAAVTVSYSGAGTLAFASGDVRAFNNRTVTNNVTSGIITSPYITKAEVLPSSADVIQVTFNENVNIADASKFKVKVNDKPAVRIGWFSNSSVPMLDRTSEIRDVTKAQSAAGNEYDTVWLLTMSTPTKHGEIIRLAANDQSAYTDGFNNIPAPLSIPAGQWPLSQFIVRNLTPRTGTSPSVPGFYENGADITGQLTAAAADADFYQEAIAWLAVDANRIPGATYTIVLGADQDYNAADTFTAAQVPGAATAADNTVAQAENGFTIVLAADGTRRVITVKGTGTGDGPRGTHNGTTSDGSALVLRNGVTLIIEENVIIQHENQGLATGTASKFPLIAIRDGGKLILDGGEIRGNYVTAGTAGANTQQLNAGGVFVAATDDTGAECTLSGEAFFIMNSGKVTGNTVVQNERGTSAGGIVLQNKAYFIMHGGEVSNNKLIYRSTVPASAIVQFYSGGIAGFGSPTDNDSSNARTNLAGVYITGGKIGNNDITNNGANRDVRISAGGVILVGTFQKTGGTISGNTNNMGAMNSVGQYKQVVVNYSAGANKTEANIFYRNADAGEDVILFTEGIRTLMNNGSNTGRDFGAGFKPPFMPSFGSAATGFFPNAWEN